MSAFEKQLFKQHSNGKIGDYIITVEIQDDDTAKLIRTSTKVIGGKPIENITHIQVGKNIGRANETTPAEQAIKEAETKVKAQLKKGYVRTLEDTSKPVTNQNGDPLPILATKLKDITTALIFPVILQRKLNGHRMLSMVKAGVVFMYSREGCTINMPHISKELQSLYDADLWDGNVIDGELYRHGWTLAQISRCAKKLRPESVQLTYNLYDAVEYSQSFTTRFASLYDMFEKAKHNLSVNALRLETNYIAHDQVTIDKLHTQFMKERYEGTMIRQGDDAGYEGRRCAQLIKRKDSEDAEFKIVGWSLGKPNIKSDMIYQVPVWLLENDEGERFECLAQGNMQEKHALYEQGLDNFIGKLLTVRYWELTERGVPPNAVALQFKVIL